MASSVKINCPSENFDLYKQIWGKGENYASEKLLVTYLKVAAFNMQVNIGAVNEYVMKSGKGRSQPDLIVM